MKKLVLAVILIAVFAMTGAAFAQATAKFAVQANVLSSCRFVGGPIGTLNFGDYKPTLIGDIDSQTSFSYRCTRGTKS